ncbi:MAG: hypothetical protein NTY85_04980 [Actinobacteria bacterium]|nr:hypothetical protein [Actinomycetota bacterium]
MKAALLKDFECLIEEQKILGVSPQGKEFADFDRWIEEFPEFEKPLRIWTRETLNFLDRNSVREIAQRSILEGQIDFAFLIVMVWGYSGDARGPARTRLIMEQLNFSDSLLQSISFLNQNQILNAYESLVISGPKHLSTSFGTKLLYFFSNSENEVQPLIFDRRIFNILSDLDMSVGKSPVLTSKQYMDYLELASKLAKQYSISIGEIEEHLFILSGVSTGSYAWKRKISTEELSPDQRDKLAALLANTFVENLQNPIVLVNGNGGGQYGGYVATGLLGKVPYELHATTRTNINLIEPEMIRIEWDLVIQRGIAQTVRDLLGVNY